LLGGTGDGIAGDFSRLRAFATVQRLLILLHVLHRPQVAATSIIVRRAIVAEVRDRGGRAEIMLVGQTVNAWRDRHQADWRSLHSNITAGRLEPSPHPKDFTAKMTISPPSTPQSSIHLPLQSGSDTMCGNEPEVHAHSLPREGQSIRARWGL
jgi:hypothetical protein